MVSVKTSCFDLHDLRCLTEASSKKLLAYLRCAKMVGGDPLLFGVLVVRKAPESEGDFQIVFFPKR